MYPAPRYFLMVFALAGDSTITRALSMFRRTRVGLTTSTSSASTPIAFALVPLAVPTLALAPPLSVIALALVGLADPLAFPVAGIAVGVATMEVGSFAAASLGLAG